MIPSPPTGLTNQRTLGPAALWSDDKRAFVQRLFTSIAPRYDWFNRLVSFGLDQRWRTVALRRGQVDPGTDVLDVCAGTGDLAMLCAERQHGSGSTIGMDLNLAMLQRAHSKSAACHRQVAWIQGDAELLPFATGTFDRVTIGFSTRNLSDLAVGLGEMVRVLRPHGRLVILETGRPSNPLVWVGYLCFLFTVARVIGVLLTGRWWPFTYLARSVRHFLTPAQMLEQLRSVQTEPEYVPLTWGLASLYVAVKR